MGEQTLLARTGGAATARRRHGADLQHGAFGGGLMALWYHFAIMFEALFILTTVDAGTRVGRFMLQELAGHVWAPLGRTSWYPEQRPRLGGGGGGLGLVPASRACIDPLGGINSLWPLFGISNQLLAAVALCVGTTVIDQGGQGAVRLGHRCCRSPGSSRSRFTAGWQKVLSPDPRLGFLSLADRTMAKVNAGEMAAELGRQVAFNARLDATAHGDVRGGDADRRGGVGAGVDAGDPGPEAGPGARRRPSWRRPMPDSPRDTARVVSPG